ncbi:MAG: hypothetical protein QXN08_06410 [Nitrososphaerales archaeon]
MFPIMFEKTMLVRLCEFRLTLFAACFIDKRPMMVIGRLFMALAPIVTTMLGASTDRNSGNERVFVKRYAKNSTG